MPRDLVCAVVLLCVAAGYYAAATGISRSTLADEVGAHGLPFVYAALLAAVALLLGAKSLLDLVLSRRRAEAPAVASGPSTAVRLKRAAGLLGIGIGYLILVPLLGYLAAIAVTLAATAVYEGERPSVRVGLIAVAGAIFLWLLFDRVLGIRMPAFAAW